MRKNVLKGYFALVYSLTLFFVLINNLAGKDVDQFTFFYYFTQQSNMLVLAWLVLLSVNLFTNGNKFKFTRNKLLMVALTVYISITYFIVALVLNPIYTGAFNPVSNGSELWLHHLTPIVMWIMIAIIPGEGELNVKKALLTLVYPLFYVVLNLIVGSTVKFANGDPAFAYAFINPASYGGNILIYALVLLGLLIVFSLFTVGVTKFKLFIDQNEERA